MSVNHLVPIAGAFLLLTGIGTNASSGAARAQATFPAAVIEVRLQPGVVLRGHNAAITIRGIKAPSLQVRVVGATVNLGHLVPWTPLRFTGDHWHGVLPAPEFRGVYRLRLRVARGTPVLRSDAWLLRVYARGTLSRAAFGTPEAVARAWVRALPGHARLAAIKRWPRPAFDRRDRQLHQLLVIAYTINGNRTLRARRGIFITAVRDSGQGRWRLLEATVTP
jgi:hypothetical protein